MMEKSRLLDTFRQYLESYVQHMFGCELTTRNLDRIFSESVKNERYAYPLYFIWILPEYKELYLRSNKEKYMILGKNFLKHMLDLPQYNSYFVTGLYKEAKLPRALHSGYKLTKAKRSLGDKSLHMLKGAQKFIWSWASFVERSLEELSAV